jgi:inner membrane protein
MIGNTHIALGLLSAVLVKEVLHLPVTPADIVICVIGALLPDIDEPSSTISKPGWLLFPYLPRTLVRLLNALTRIVSKLLNWIFGHRSITHWPVFPVFLVLLSVELDSIKLLLFAVGYASHLLGDLCTAQGIPLWAPLSLKRTSWMKIRVGGLVETVFSTFLWLGLLIYFCFGNLPQLKRLLNVL